MIGAIVCLRSKHWLKRQSNVWIVYNFDCLFCGNIFIIILWCDHCFFFVELCWSSATKRAT